MEKSQTPNLNNSDVIQDLPKHEEKICPNCSRIFECKVGSISLCQCTKVTLSLEEREYLAQQFADCLCYQCMEKLAFEYRIAKSYKTLTWSF